jgi:hypothetical protein
MTGGLGYCGDLGCGCLSIDGLIRNLEIVPGHLGTAMVRFDFSGWFATEEESALLANDLDFWLYQNGEPVVQMQPGEWVQTEAVGGVTFDLDVGIIRRDWQNIPLMWIEAGDRALLQWQARTETDVRAYRVYTDNATGTVSYSTPAATVSSVRVQRVVSAGPSTGTGTGRISIDGVYTGEGANGTWTLRIAGAGKYEIDRGDGYGDELDFFEGLAADVGDGVFAVFLDSPSDYDTGDTFDFFVGVETRWLSQAREPGTYKFTVAAVDGAGNQGTASAERSVVLVNRLDPPTGQTATANIGDEEIDLAWTDADDNDVTGVRVYTNYNTITETVEPWVIEEAPIATIAPETEAYTLALAEGTEGELLFYLRSTDGTNEEDNAVLVRVTMAAAEAASLAPVQIIEGRAIAAGKVRVVYVVWVSGGVPTSLNVYYNSTNSWEGATLEETFAFSQTVGFARKTWESDDAIPATRWWGIRAVDSEGNLGPVSDLVQIVPDNTAPGQVAWGSVAPA